MNWFTFTGTDPSQSTHYTLTSGTPICTAPTQQMCAVQAIDDGNGEPIITDTLKDEIMLALQNQVNNAHVRLKSR